MSVESSREVKLADGAGVEAEGGRGRRQVITGVVIAGFCVFLQLYAPQPLLVIFRETFHASEAQVSLIVSAASLAVALASPVMGMIADAVGRKRVAVPCLFALAIATFFCATSKSISELIFWRFVAGACTPGVIAVILAYISEESPKGTAASVTALYVTGTVLGGLTGRLSSAFVADHSSWRWSFVVLSLLTLVGAICTWLFLPRSRHFVPQREWRQSVRAMGRHLRNKRLLATYLVGFNALFCHVGMFTYANFHLAKPPFSLSTSALGSIFAVYALGLLVTPISGRLIDRVGHRSGAGLAVSLIAGGALLMLIPNLLAFVAGIAVASTGVFISQAAASSHIGVVAEGSRSAAAGLYVACYYLGGSAGATALVIPWHAGGWPAVIGMVLAVQAVSLLVTRRCFSNVTRATHTPVPAVAPSPE